MAVHARTLEIYAKLDIADRAPDSALSMTLNGFPADAPRGGDAVPADSGNEVELARTRVPRQSYYLLRPDGHVGLCGSRLDPAAVAGYISGRLRVQAGGA